MIRAAIAVVLLSITAALAEPTVEITNNQPFPIRMPWTLRGEDLSVILVDVPANGHQTIKPQAGPPDKRPAPQLMVRADDPGTVQLEFAGTKLGRLQWGIVLEALEQKPA